MELPCYRIDLRAEYAVAKLIDATRRRRAGQADADQKRQLPWCVVTEPESVVLFDNASRGTIESENNKRVPKKH